MNDKTKLLKRIEAIERNSNQNQILEEWNSKNQIFNNHHTHISSTPLSNQPHPQLQSNSHFVCKHCRRSN